MAPMGTSGQFYDQDAAAEPEDRAADPSGMPGRAGVLFDQDVLFDRDTLLDHPDPPDRADPPDRTDAPDRAGGDAARRTRGPKPPGSQGRERQGPQREVPRVPAPGHRAPRQATRRSARSSPPRPPTQGRDAPSPAQAGSEQSSLGRSTGVLAAGTFLSRLTGFIRVAVAAGILGANGLSDAYNFANSVPNIIYDLLLGGILSATLIPVFVDELRRENRRERERAISAILTTIAAALVVVTLILYLLAPLVIHFYLLLNHTAGKGNELAVATSLLRLFAPQVFFLGAIVVSTALLNARRRFAAAAFSPVVNNVIAIAALVAAAVVAHTRDVGVFRHDHGGLLVLGLGTTLGYIVQFVVQLPAMARSGLVFRPVWEPRHPAVRRVAGLSAWLIGVVVANQISFNLIAVIAGHKNGGYTTYQIAYQFFQLPYALLAVSIASAIMPDLANLWFDGNRTAFLGRLINGLRVTLALLIPAAVGYALVVQPVVDLAARHGGFNASDARLLAGTLEFFALGLPGFSAFLPLIRALQAMKDTRAMFFIYALENALSVVLAFALYPSFGDRGLAVAFVGPYTVAAIVAARYIRRKVGPLGGVYTARSIGRTIVATAAMAVVVVGIDAILPHGTAYPVLVVRLLVDVGAGAAVFLLLARWLGIDDLQPVLRLIGPVLARIGLAPRRPAGAGSRRPPVRPVGRRP